MLARWNGLQLVQTMLLLPDAVSCLLFESEGRRRKQGEGRRKKQEAGRKQEARARTKIKKVKLVKRSIENVEYSSIC